MTEEKDPEYYTLLEASKLIPGGSVRSLQRWCREGRIGSQKIVGKYMIPKVSLDEFLKIRR